MRESDTKGLHGIEDHEGHTDSTVEHLHGNKTGPYVGLSNG